MLNTGYRVGTIGTMIQSVTRTLKELARKAAEHGGGPAKRRKGERAFRFRTQSKPNRASIAYDIEGMR